MVHGNLSRMFACVPVYLIAYSHSLDLCLFLQEEYCFYADWSGMVRDTAMKLADGASKMGQQLSESWGSWLQKNRVRAFTNQSAGERMPLQSLVQCQPLSQVPEGQC